MLNLVCIIGTLTRDIEVRYTPNGNAVANMNIASVREYKHKDELKKEICFVNVTIWGQRAENCSESLKKDDPIFIKGRLQSRSVGEGDQKRSIIEIVAEQIQFLNRKEEGTSEV